MNIVICARDIKGGIRSHLRLLVRRLSLDEDVETIHLISASPPEDLGDKVKNHPIALGGRTFLTREPLFLWRCTRRIKEIVAATDIDLLDIHQPALLRRFGVPSIYTVHITHRQFVRQAARSLPYWPLALVHALFTWIDRRQMKLCDRIVFVSGRTMAEFQNRYRFLEDKAQSLPNFFDGESFFPIGPQPLRKFKREAGIPADAFLLIYGGRLDPNKNLGGLMSALELLEGQGENVYLLVAGDGRLRPELEAHPRCICLGKLDSDYLNLAYNAADLTVLPSFTENSPSVVLESIAAGTAVVSTDVGDVSEILPPQLIIPGFSARAIAQKIQEIIGQDPAVVRSWVKETGRRVTTEFSASSQAGRKLDLYRQILASWRPQNGGKP